MYGYWEHLQQLSNAGRAFVSVTLVDVVASAPATIGAKMLVTAEGFFHGTVGGGKIEAKAIAEAVGMLGTSGQRPVARGQKEKGRHEGMRHINEASRFVEWNLQADVGMTCGGVVRLFFEVYNAAAWPIVIFGAGHCSQALVRLLLTMQCQVTVIDPREEWLRKLPSGTREGDGGEKLRVVHAERPMAEYVKELPSRAFVLLMTMGHSSDQPILVEVLRTRTEAFAYLGVIGSVAKAGALKRGLMAAGLSEEMAQAGKYYYCPIGLPIGTNDPAEIAISVAAQLLERRDALRTTGGHP